MRAVGDKQRGAIRPEFDRSISIDFQRAKITSDTGFLLIKEMDHRKFLGKNPIPTCIFDAERRS